MRRIVATSVGAAFFCGCHTTAPVSGLALVCAAVMIVSGLVLFAGAVAGVDVLMGRRARRRRSRRIDVHAGEPERRIIYCTRCNKTHAVKRGEEPCAPGAWGTFEADWP